MRHLALVTLVTLAVTACDSAPTTAPMAGPKTASYTISDGAHNAGNARFYFLPPMVPSTSFTGIFDATASPVVEICALATPTTCSSGAPLASYSMTTGTHGELIKIDPANQHYSVKWRTKEFNLSTTIIYRIRVLLGATEIGYADVQIAPSNQEAKNVNTNEYIPLVDDRLLNILFRIERGAAGPSTITIDATALSVTTIGLDGFSVFPTATVQSFALGAGSYKLSYYAGVSQPNVIFTVTSAGTVDYDPALDGVLTGRGTTSLRVNGRTIQIDATPLSVPYLAIFGVFSGATEFPASVVKTMTLLPAIHQLLYNAGVSQPSVVFALTNAGTVDYASALDGVLDGRGTSTLRVNGRTIQLDATPLSVPYLAIFGVFSGATEFPSSVVKTMTLLPAIHQLLYNAGVSQPSVVFALTNAGTVDYAPSLDGVLDGRGTSTLRVNGRTIQLDATPLSVPYLAIFGVFSGATEFPSSVVKTMTLLPAIHQLLYNAGVSQPSVVFALTNAGTVDYAPSLDGVLDGRGTSTLRVNGRTIQVDATGLGVATFDVFGVGTFPATSVQSLTLLASLHEIRAGARNFTFGILGDGTLSYDAVLYPYLTGAGTTLLEVH